jgi:transglutaminase-like putative cysteine protease
MLHSVFNNFLRGRFVVKTAGSPCVAPIAPRLRRTAFALALCAASLAPAIAADTAPSADLGHTIAAIDGGHFKEAEAAIDRALAQPGLAPQARRDWLFQRERMRRILLDFTLDADAVKTRVRKQIPDLTDAEFARWDAAGLFEHQTIDGRTLYFKRSPANLFRLSAEARDRRKDKTPLTDGPMESLNDYHRQVRAAALAEHETSVLPHRVRMTQTVTVDANAVPAGETVRAWIPYPQELPGQQDDVRYVASVPARHEIAPASAPMRTVYLEQLAKAGEKTVFSVTYEVTLSAQYRGIDPDKVTAARITPELAPYVAERVPHVVFTDDLRKFSKEVVGDEKNPYRIVQKLFAAVDRIPWAGAREYSTISNISDYTLHAGHGDCGQQTLLLITLLRLNGIPARWQSGMVFAENGYDNIHDWGQVYLAPYGWVPMDVTTGQLHPAKAEDAPLQWFYLGGLDAWRIAFNRDFGQPFVPPKQHFRSDDVDSQRGEVEWKGGNLYFDQWDYHFEWQLLPDARGRAGS